MPSSTLTHTHTHTLTLTHTHTRTAHTGARRGVANVEMRSKRENQAYPQKRAAKRATLSQLREEKCPRIWETRRETVVAPNTTV